MLQESSDIIDDTLCILPESSDIIDDTLCMLLESSDITVEDIEMTDQPNDIVLIASRIASLRRIDLNNKHHRLRSIETLLESELYENLSKMTREEKYKYSKEVFPLLEEMNGTIYEHIIEKIISCKENIHEASGAIFEYELNLRDIMIMNGKEIIAKSLVIGNKTSVLLDPEPVKRTPKEHFKRIPVLHSERPIDSTDNLLKLADNASTNNNPKEQLFAALLTERTKAISIYLDNIKRTQDVEWYNKGQTKQNTVLARMRSCTKLMDRFNLSCSRYDYLLDHYNSLRILGCADYHINLFNVNNARIKLAQASEHKHSYDMYAIMHIKNTRGTIKKYEEYYDILLSKIREGIDILDLSSIEITHTLDSCLSDLGVIKVKLPRLIRLTSRGRNIGKPVNNPDIIKIQHTRMNRRYVTTDDIVPDFHLNSMREAETLKLEIGHMSRTEVVENVAQKLINISDGRETTAQELRKLAKLLYESNTMHKDN